MQTGEARLKVMEALQEEAYKGIVRIDSGTMGHIKVRPGDIVEIEGNRKTVAIVDRAYPSDVGQEVIRMDGIVRRNAKTGIGEVVNVRTAEVKEAKSVTVAPAQQGVMIQAHPDVFKRGLLGRAMIKGDIVALGGTNRRKRTLSDSPLFDEIFNVFGEDFMGNFGLSSLKFIVVDTNPKEAVIISDGTEIKVNPKAMEVIEENIPEVNYEDIGGLSDEIIKIREMVELPLRHPEIFKKLGIEPPAGVLLHGPPGTGKTLLAKAVANESEANFILINGPEIMNKFYGECVDENSLVFTNGIGLTPINEAIQNSDVHNIAALDFENQKTSMLPISDRFDKGVQNTLTVKTPHGSITTTPTSRLLVLRNGEPEWVFVKDLKKNDFVATSKNMPRGKEEIPILINFLKNNNYLQGDKVRKIFDLYNGYGKNKETAEILGIKQRRLEDLKYRKSVPVKIIKKLIEGKEDLIEGDFNLMGKGKIPFRFNSEIAYLIGLIIGDGHLRYTYKNKHVTTIHFTNDDKKVVEKYKKNMNDVFGIKDIKYDGKYGYYFSSSIIGTLLHKLGIPYSDKSHNAIIPNYVLNLPDEMLKEFIKGLFDSDGEVHFVKSGRQIIHYTMSEKLNIGLRLALLRFNIQTTLGRKKDGTYILTISDVNSIDRFRKEIGFNHIKRNKRLKKEIIVKYNKPVYDRIPVYDFLKNIAKEYKISKREFLRNKINLFAVKSYTDKQIKKTIRILKRYKVDYKEIEKLELLNKNDILWSPIKEINEGTAHVYDLTVPKDHNFIANGFIVHNSEKRLREVFEEAEKNAPSIIFIDEIDAIAPKREEVHGELERRVVAQMLALMDGLKNRGRVVVIAATNRPNAIDPALRRPGRFDREISFGVPDKKGRLNILKIHTRNMPLDKTVNLKDISAITHGFVGADLNALAKEAAMNVLRRLLPDFTLREKDPIPKELLDKLVITGTDFKESLKIVRPSAMREVLVEIPNVKWENVGGLESTKQELKEAVEWPLKYPSSFKRLGIKPPRGILLYGPPGTGKTMLAKAVANESEANFILVKGPELLNKFVGESEKGVRKVFEKARQTAPTIVFFDEIDSIAPRRGTDSSKVTERIVNTMLSEMDGLEEMHDVIVLAATNRPDMVDSALLRPGRFDRTLMIPVPDEESRLEILKIHTKDMPLEINKEIIKELGKKYDDNYIYEESKILSKMAGDEPIKSENIKKKKIKFKELNDREKILYYISKDLNNFTGADIENLCREAAILALRENIKADKVRVEHFEEIMKKVKPSITENDLETYKRIEEEYLKTARGAAIKKEAPTYFG